MGGNGLKREGACRFIGRGHLFPGGSFAILFALAALCLFCAPLCHADAESPTPTPKAVYLPLVLRPADPTPQPTVTSTATPSATATHTATATPTRTPTATATWTPTPTLTRTGTPSATTTHTRTVTRTPTATPTRAAHLFIAEIQPAGHDEYIAIRNDGNFWQDMTGWRIQSYRGSDCAPANQWFNFPAGYLLASGKTVRVHSGPGAVDNPHFDLLWTLGNIWADEGDVGVLFNAAGEEVDRYRYGACGQ